MSPKAYVDLILITGINYDAWRHLSYGTRCSQKLKRGDSANSVNERHQKTGYITITWAAFF
jgi:hypothetical protein